MFTVIDLDYIQILLPIIFFTIVLLFVSNSSLFNPHNNNVKKSPANFSFNAIDAQLNDDFRRRQKWEYEQVKAITAKYLEIGGEVYIGTDAPAGTWVYPGLSMIEELHEFKSFNLDAFDILKKATVEAKAVTGEDDSYLLLNGNSIEQFENILDINTVFVDGKSFKHSEIANHIIEAEEMMRMFEEVEKKYEIL